MKDNEKLTFGKLIGRLRRSKQLSQEELAYRSNIHTKTLSDIERDVYYPGVEIFVRIAKKLDISPIELFLLIKEKGILADMEKGTNDDHD
ncbi:DNA-binding transcriptional regulator, XRE-family HTH domain [Bacillus sp. OV166]|uniref:helix-turn-helix domain-containing protein n=1 Tax=Bacillus sp. OV166 TaxID=1882763 RepID=UPI000A2AA679|nr:helix-turn-helix transcriptional regulator [Bacillus sp. OV166]SMQ85052.1 DNA-binding transcriptional regulator, XRE-family HTH domain [Bacillus sp. OV166]